MAYWIWLALGLALTAAEVVRRTFVLIWLGLAALVVGFAVWLLPELERSVQLTFFAVLSLGLLAPAWVIRTRVRHYRSKS